MIRPRKNAGRRGLIFVAVLGAGAVGAGSALAGTRVLDYGVRLAVFGQIGAYQNAIESSGRVTTVQSNRHCLVGFLGIVLHREDAYRIERWEDGRLVYFDGTTTTNGEVVHVHGEARGDRFAVTSAKGTFLASGDLFPSNPWSAAFITARKILHVTTGEIEEATVTGGEARVLTVAGRPVLARAYHIETALTHAVVWLDQRDVPVFMEVAAHGHTVFLDLQSVIDH